MKDEFTRIRRRWLESLVIVLSIACSAALVVSIACIVAAYADSTRRHTDRLNAREVDLFSMLDVSSFDRGVTRAGTSDTLRVTFSDRMLDEISDQCPAIVAGYIRYHLELPVDQIEDTEQAVLCEHAPSMLSARFISPQAFRAYDLTPAHGTLFGGAEYDEGARVVVLGAEIAKRLFDPEFTEVCIGKRIALDGKAFTIIGILHAKSDIEKNVYWPADWTVFIPATVYYPEQRDKWALMSVMVSKGADIHLAISQIRSYVDSHLGNDTVAIESYALYSRDYYERMRPLISLIVILTSLIFAASGINILHIFNARNTAHAIEHAITRAIGAAKSRIIGACLAEATILGVLAGIPGALVSLVLYRGLRYVIDSGGLPTSGSDPVSSLLIGLMGFTTALVSIVCVSIQPAYRASRVQCAVLLREE